MRTTRRSSLTLALVAALAWCLPAGSGPARAEPGGRAGRPCRIEPTRVRRPDPRDPSAGADTMPPTAGELAGQDISFTVLEDDLNNALAAVRKAANEQRGRTSGVSLDIARAVDEVADELGVSSAQVAVAWVQAQGYGFIPIVGARKPEQVVDTLGAARAKLDASQLERLASVSEISLGFPHEFLGSDRVQDLVKGECRTRLLERPR